MSGRGAVRTNFLWAILSLALLPCITAAEPACPLKAAASVPLSFEPDGRPSISAQMNGTKELLIVDTGAPISLIKDTVVDELKLPLTPIPQTYKSVMGVSPTATANVETLSLGALTGHDAKFFLVPTVQIPSPFAGSFGADFLQAWDTDFDFGKSVLNLIAPGRCKDNPVYWTKRAHASLPLKDNDAQHIVASAKLDGKDFDATLDTGSAGSLMDLAVAAQVFGIHEEGLHTFKSIDFGGLTIERPSILVLADSNLHGYQLLIGMPILKKMHLYISYRDKLAYVTRSDKH